MVIDSISRAREAGIDRAREGRIGRELSSQFSSAQILQRAVRQAVKGVDGCDHAGISLRSPHVSLRDAAKEFVAEGGNE